MITEMYFKVKNLIADFIEDESGVTAVEYAVIAVAMSAVLLLVFKNGTMKDILNNAMTAIQANVDSAK
ncbi:Flp family type IVb pilin [Photobacterium swingsii]|uniref:Flp family type IVb pilin n=1 Tax=Photobacterium swingsii TaxID=680026 RepID=UPI003D14CF83